MREYCIDIISTPSPIKLFLCPSPFPLKLMTSFIIIIFADVWVHDLLSSFRVAPMYKVQGRPLVTGRPLMELLPGEDRSSLSLPRPRWGPVTLACCLLSPRRSCLGNQTVKISCRIPFFRASCMLRRYCLETGILVLWFFQSLYSIKPRETQKNYVSAVIVGIFYMRS